MGRETRLATQRHVRNVPLQELIRRHGDEHGRALHHIFNSLSSITDPVKENAAGWEAINELWPDRDDFIQNNFWITTKRRSQKLLLRYNQGQRKLNQIIRDLQEKGRPVRVIVLKARQLGISTQIQGELFDTCARYPDVNAGCIADENKHAREIYRKTIVFKRNLYYLPEFVATSREEMELANGSHYMVMTAGNLDTGRSFTGHLLHASEFAFWPNAHTVWGGLMQTIGNEVGTVVIIESTANGMSNLFYDTWQTAQDPDSDWVPVFLPWHTEPTYTKTITASDAKRIEDSLSPTETRLRQRFGLTIGQLAWRRTKIRDDCHGSELKFRQEYPSDPQEAFVHSGHPAFDLERLAELDATNEEPIMTGRLILA